MGSAVVVRGLSCPVAHGIFPDQGLNPCPLPWQVDSQLLDHQGSPPNFFFLEGLNTLYFIYLFIYFLIWAFFPPNFIIFGCAGSPSLHGLFSNGREQGLLSSRGVHASDCGSFSCCRAWALGCMGFSSCSSRALGL